jgi:SAM-dependent methyltransferase
MAPTQPACPSCGSSELDEFYSVDDVPVNNCLVVDTAAAGKAFPRGNLRIALCTACGFITNTAFELARTTYDRTYEETQTFSPTFTAFQDQLIRRLLEKYDLWGKTVVEIGCGKGTFLARMAELGDVRGFGIDPTAVPERLTGKAAKNVQFINEFYGPQHARLEADLVICRHTLEHIPNVGEFLRKLHDVIAPQDVPVFFELPETLRVLRDAAYWDIYFEHCSYFTPGSLTRAFEYAGFDVYDVRIGFDNQYLMLEAQPSGAGTHYSAHLDQAADIAREVRAFQRAVEEKRRAWRAYFDDVVRSGKRVAIWGSGSKGVAFMSTLNLNAEIPCLTDVNPYRAGKFIVGNGKEIIAPERLRDEQIDEVVVMNPIYRAEVTAMLRNMGIDANVLTADDPMVVAA